MTLYGRFIEPDKIQIKRIHINTDPLNKVLKGKKIVHLSDLHLAKFGKKEIKILETIEQIQPDLIFLTGDYIKWKGDIDPALKFLSRLKAKHGVFAVMGDYDYSNSRVSCLFCHEKGKAQFTRQHNVIMLKNSSHKIKLNNQTVEVAGIDESSGEPLLIRSDTFKDHHEGDNSPLVKLVLSHSPLAFDKFSGKDKILMFAGDTHGGQIKLPKFLFKLLGYDKNRYNYGLFNNGSNIMYVTRGIGTSHFKFRLFCPPEITIFEF